MDLVGLGDLDNHAGLAHAHGDLDHESRGSGLGLVLVLALGPGLGRCCACCESLGLKKKLYELTSGLSYTSFWI